MIDSIAFFINREIEATKSLLAPENRFLLVFLVVSLYVIWTKLGLRELVYLAWILSKKIVFICLDIFRYFKNKRGRHENC